MNSWVLTNRPGKPKVWIEPIIDRETQTISYEVREGGEPSHERTVDRGNGTCIATGSAILGEYIKAESRAGRMGQQLMTVVAEGDSGRAYLPATPNDADAAACEEPEWKPAGRNPEKLTGGTVYVYGLDEWWKLFTPRQLTALTAFSDLVAEAAGRVEADALAAGMGGDGARLRDSGSGAAAYADAVATYLALAVDKCADSWSTICSWNVSASEHKKYVCKRRRFQ